jgi:predicted P-loop ATPase
MTNLIRKWLREFLKAYVYERDERGSNGLLSSKTERMRIAKGVREFIEQNYELRYNTMKQTEEFRPKIRDEASERNYKTAKNGCDTTIENYETTIWRQLTDREMRKIAIEQMEQVGVAWSMDVELYVRSALIPPYNPVADYLGQCGEWDGREDYIGQMASRVPTSYRQWTGYFHRWMLAMVAQWMNLSRDFGNAIVPMLIGGQGTHKSTFCKLILPPELREYYIDDIKLDSAEQVERMLGRMLLVNIDEYNAKTAREQAKIKRILTEKDVQSRKMRSDQYVLLPRMASFIATTNEHEPLCDTTGSRRYLCCEVEGIIDTDSPVPYRQMYAQAVAELRNGATYWFSKTEEAEVERHNQAYRQQSSPEEILLSYFEPAERKKENFIRAIDIQDELRQHVRPTDLPSLKALTTALKNAHFPYGSYNGYRGWYARKKI